MGAMYVFDNLVVFNLFDFLSMIVTFVTLIIAMNILNRVEIIY